MNEHEFPRLRDALAVLSELVEAGLGDLPMQIIVAPDSTVQALARHSGAKDDDKPALLIEFEVGDGRRVSIISTERLGNPLPRAAIQ